MVINTTIKLRSMVIAPKGKLLIACDLSQAETWVVAYLANDFRMKNALLHSDIHRETGAFLFKKALEEVTTDERYLSKRINHASNYGMSPPRFAQVINAEADKEPYLSISVAEAKKLMDAWHKLYTSIAPWWLSVQMELREKQMTLTTPYLRKRTFYGPPVHDTYKTAYAFLPQSTVADHFNGQIQPDGVKGGMLEIWRRLCDDEIKLINQAHDSCMLEVPKEHALDILKEVKQILKRPLVINGESCTIPVDGEIGERWGELEKVA